MNCKSTPYKNLFDSYIKDGIFGGMDYSFFEPQDAEKLGKIVATSGYIVNKNWNDIVKYQAPKHSFFFRVYDHIRVIEEVLTGMFTSDNKEFNLIINRFIPLFMMNSVYLIYSEELKTYELKLAKKRAEEESRDPYEAVERAYPNSNFRLLRRVSSEGKGYRWDAVLSGLENIEVEEFLPAIDGEMATPIRFSFNEGYL